MRAITVRPPWSWAISHGPKRIENRGWTRGWRGQLAIHAGKSWDIAGGSSPLVRRDWLAAGHSPTDLTRRNPLLAQGAIAAVADLVDICTVQGGYTDCACGEWAVPFQCHWKLANVRALAEPIPARGALGLWAVPDAAAEQILRTVGGGEG